MVDPLEVAEAAAVAAVAGMEIEIEEAVGKHNEKELHFKIPLNIIMYYYYSNQINVTSCTTAFSAICASLS